MNVFCVVIIFLTTLCVLTSGFFEKPPQKRILKLKNVNFNKTKGKPKSAIKSEKNKTIFVLSNPVRHSKKLYQPKPTELLKETPTTSFNFLNFDAYIVKPFNVNYTALLSNRPSDVEQKKFDKEYTTPEYTTTEYPQIEVLDFGRAQPLIQTTIPPPPETTSYEATTAKITNFFPLGLAYFDSLRKYRKAFDNLRKPKRVNVQRTTTSEPITTTTETEAPFIESTTIKEYVYVTTPAPNFDEDLYQKEPYFESYRSKPRFDENIDYEYENGRSRYETTTRYLDYETLDIDDNHHHETTELATTTNKPSTKSKKRKSKNKNAHSANVKSNFLYDRFINYPQEERDESRRVVLVAKPENGDDVTVVRNDTESVRNNGGGSKQQNPVPSQVPMQRHYFQ